MTTSQENLEDRLRRVLHEQAQALQVHPAEWHGPARAVGPARPRRSPLLGGLALGFFSAIALAIVAAALVLAGHDHTGTKPGAGVPGHVQAATTPSVPPASIRSTPPDCATAGIDAQRLREGMCVSGANTFVVVNKTSTLHLKSLAANYVGLHRNGRFAIVTITIKNKLDAPQHWQDTMAGLFIPNTGGGAGNGPDYLEDVNAETADQSSCLRKTRSVGNGGLQPGASVTCDVVFDIPAAAGPASQGSTLEIANFGDDVSNPPSQRPIGIIRTYH